MPKYDVYLEVTQTYRVTVGADDRAEAVEIAFDTYYEDGIVVNYGVEEIDIEEYQ